MYSLRARELAAPRIERRETENSASPLSQVPISTHALNAYNHTTRYTVQANIPYHTFNRISYMQANKYRKQYTLRLNIVKVTVILATYSSECSSKLSFAFVDEANSS